MVYIRAEYEFFCRTQRLDIAIQKPPLNPTEKDALQIKAFYLFFILLIFFSFFPAPVCK